MASLTGARSSGLYLCLMIRANELVEINKKCSYLRKNIYCIPKLCLLKYVRSNLNKTLNKWHSPMSIFYVYYTQLRYLENKINKTISPKNHE